MISLSKEQAHTLFAFCEAFDLRTTGAWTAVEDEMRNVHGVENPEEALEDAKSALNG